MGAGGSDSELFSARINPNFRTTRAGHLGPTRSRRIAGARWPTRGGIRKGVPQEILPGVHVYADPADVARGATRLFIDYAWQAIAQDGQFKVALSGGNTPRQMLALLATDEFRGQVTGPRYTSFWSDERAVPSHECREQLRNGAPRIAHSSSDFPRAMCIAWRPKSRVSAARPTNTKRFSGNISIWMNRGFPRFHLIYLGMGKDRATPRPCFPARALHTSNVALGQHTPGKRK